MRTTQWMTAGICAGLLFSARASFADGVSPSTTQTPSAPAPTDKAFLVRALGVNQLELMLGQMAVKRAAAPEVRAMGEKMVQKHTEFGRQLSDLAQIAPTSEAPKLSADQQRTYVRLASLSGTDFDKSFKETVNAGHVQELAMYREEVGHAVDPRLVALAQGRVATLEKSMANAVQAMNVAPKKHDW
jgi:putative membrane protein